ncbi:MAG: hypothetical protein LBI59_10100, partial [Candidatus Accumulibacter sp.]|nr:hypothetical protein [Accumulibacter sp.]
EAGWLWIGIGLALTVINIVIALVPMIGDLATSLLFPVFGGGLMLGCHAIDAGEDLRFGHLFAGFQNKLGRLLMISVLCLPVIFVIAAAGFFFVVAPIEESIGYFYNRMPPELNLSLLLSVILFSSVLVALLCMAAWFAPALVALHEEPTAFEAMKLSFRGCLRNWLPFLVYGLVFIVLAILASLILLLGWLVLMPVIYCSTYAAYRDIFTVERR